MGFEREIARIGAGVVDENVVCFIFWHTLAILGRQLEPHMGNMRTGNMWAKRVDIVAYVKATRVSLILTWPITLSNCLGPLFSRILTGYCYCFPLGKIQKHVIRLQLEREVDGGSPSHLAVYKLTVCMYTYNTIYIRRRKILISI